MTLTPFHIAFPVDDLDAARTFYGTTLGCPEGRSSSEWIDFDLFGHQIVAHLKPGSSNDKAHHNAVDGHDVPVPHFGVVLPMEAWLALRSIATLPLRLERTCQNAQRIAEYLATRTDRVESVLYPGLKTHPGHDVAARLMDYMSVD